MYLKSLRMQGFKSFPDPTLIEFHEGITAIVGPNGSGKSNITDAIRWVLGEQSAKTLRGSRMEDVIFNGTETRRQLGFAEVSIAFDNTDQNIPIEYETVEVTRRYYRSGDSEYYINQTECRLKDIRELFLDTGIGRDGYSIIGQGRIDQILSDNSEERRKVFDEAAGIVKYKLRKKDTERKLERTENNLIRINDILNELEQRVKPLSNQAKKLKEYHTLKEEMENIDIALILHDVTRNIDELDQLQINQNQTQSDLINAIKLANTYKSKFNEFDDTIKAIDSEIDQLRLNQTEEQANLAENNEQYAILKERCRLLEIQNSKDEKQSEELLITLKYLDQNLNSKESDRTSLESEILELENNFKIESENLKSLNLKIKDFEQKLLKLQSELDEKKQSIFDQEKNKNHFEQEIYFVTEQVKQREKKIVENSELCNQIKSKLNQARSDLKNEKEEFQNSSQDLQNAREELETKRDLLSKLDVEQREHFNQLNNLKYRLKTLQELEQNLEGFHQTVKNIMYQANRNSEFAEGIHGPLANLIQVPEKFEKAIEVALGAAVNNIVVETKKDASRIIDWLKQTKSGRETFLPLDAIQGRVLPENDRQQIEMMSGCLGIASEKLEFQSIYIEIVNQLLGKVILAENLNSAIQISEKLKRRYRIVTLAGDVVQVGGSMTGGEFKKGSTGLLKRNREIEYYQNEIQRVLLETDSRKIVIEKENNNLMRLAQIQKDYEQKYLGEEKQLFYLEKEIEQLDIQLKSIQKDLAEEKEELSKLEKRKADAASHLSTEDFNTTHLNETIQLIEKNIQINLKQKAQLDRELIEQQEKIMASNIALKTKEATLQNFINLREQAEKDRDSQKNRYTELTEEIKNNKQILLDILEKEKLCEEQNQQFEKKISIIKNNIELKQNERISNEKQQRELFNKSEEQAELVASLNLQVERLKNRNERLEQSILSSKNYIWDNYEKTYISLNQDDYPLSDITASRDKLKNLKNKIKNLGNLNPNAITEYEEVSERFDFMTMQKQDIEKSINNLGDVITELEKAMSEQFKENFDKINKNFKEVFSALFVGGEAEVSLEDEDTLNSGIQIKAQPPGKRLQNLNLLSGGERSLTAIALLLAIFKLRPAPFCVLDEVESALDESNIIRFMDYLNSYTEYSQFMLVTHRMGTMEAADRLYGITMKERGVSKVLSLELSDADNISGIE